MTYRGGKWFLTHEEYVIIYIQINNDIIITKTKTLAKNIKIQTKFQQKRIKKHQKIKHEYKTNKAFLNQREVNVFCIYVLSFDVSLSSFGNFWWNLVCINVFS